MRASFLGVSARLAVLSAALVGAGGCGDRGVNAFWSGYIVVNEASAHRVSADEPSTIRLEVTLGNVTSQPVNSFNEARFTAGTTSAVFNLHPIQDVGCATPDPWDIPPGGSGGLSMNVSFLTDPASLTVACQVDPATGFFVSTHNYTAPRMGGALPADFDGPLVFDFRGRIDGLPCTSDKCPSLVSASSSVAVTPIRGARSGAAARSRVVESLQAVAAGGFNDGFAGLATSTSK